MLVRNDAVVALEFHQDNLNYECYLNISRNFGGGYLENFPLADHRNIFYERDRAPPNNGHLVNNHLQDLFYDQWIANNGPYLWPPRSTDLKRLKIFILNQ
ncbi:hypothetical protein WA026_001720 [Henosepilachna vigintioctopunctata]|uniref:Uncharacterized protein n=1 Tax=Henosepilachna vigintioctopunctata TaxID=420089 RepID=A0AAW1UR60_9CUCU